MMVRSHFIYTGHFTKLMYITDTFGSHESVSYSLDELHEDIVANYVAGKPII